MHVILGHIVHVLHYLLIGHGIGHLLPQGQQRNPTQHGQLQVGEDVRFKAH